MADWATIAQVSTAVGTLVLATATFGATRSANRAARVAERAFEARLRPLLVPSRLEDPAEKIMWGDQHWTRLPGGRASVELGEGAVYLSMSLRNVGSGMAVIHGWRAVPSPGFTLELQPELLQHPELQQYPDLDEFRGQGRDLYVPPGDSSFWQGAFRARDERDEREREEIAAAIRRREMIAVFLLYGDHEGGQRTISRFSLVPPGENAEDPNIWIESVNHHWNLDRNDPR
jgi:hypothetical protein